MVTRKVTLKLMELLPTFDALMALTAEVVPTAHSEARAAQKLANGDSNG